MKMTDSKKHKRNFLRSPFLGGLLDSLPDSPKTERFTIAAFWEKPAINSLAAAGGEECVMGSLQGHVWECPACASLIFACNFDYDCETHDTDVVACPVCGDKSKRVNSSHWPSHVMCVVDGQERMTAQGQKYLDYRQSNS